MEKRLDWYQEKYGPYIEERGLKNWRNLFRWPNLQEWTIFILIIMALFLGWAYKHDISSCYNYIQENQNLFTPNIILNP